MNTFLRLILTTLMAFSTVGAGAAEDPAPTANEIDDAHKNPIVVEFVVTHGTDLIDFVGPSEVFNFVQAPGYKSSPYVEYIVSDNLDPIKLLGGFVITPNYTFDTAPRADIVMIGGHIIGGQSGYSPTPKALEIGRAHV